MCSDEVLWGQGWIRRGSGGLRKKPSLEKKDSSQMREEGELGVRKGKRQNPSGKTDFREGSSCRQTARMHSSAMEHRADFLRGLMSLTT